jgi:hypothetical protein
MSTSWQIDDVDLTTAQVTVIVDADTDVQHGGQIRWQRVPILGGTEEQQKLGRDHHRGRLRFLFVGSAANRYARLAAVRRMLEDNDYVFLRAPDAPNEYYWPRAEKESAIEPEKLTVVHLGGMGAVALDVDFVLRDELLREASITATGTITAVGVVIVFASGAVTATAAITGAAFIIVLAAGAVTATGTITAVGELRSSLLTEDGQDLFTENNDTILRNI